MRQTEAATQKDQVARKDQMQAASSDSKAEEVVEVAPSEVVAVGCGVVTAAAVAGAIATYRSGSKSLLEDGINPSNRLRMIPVAVQTLLLSTLFTGIMGVGGFYALRAAGWFSQDKAQLPSASEAARMIRNPKAYFREKMQQDQQQQQHSGGNQSNQNQQPSAFSDKG